MPKVLKVKQFGLPRWAWLLILTGAAGGTLYYRARKAEQAGQDAVDSTGQPLNAPAAGDGLDVNGQGGGVPVGYYDTASGASPSAAGPDTTDPIDINGLIQALLSGDPAAEGAMGPRGKKGKVGPKGAKGKAAKHAHHMKGGGGPPNRPRHKVKVKPKPLPRRPSHPAQHKKAKKH